MAAVGPPAAHVVGHRRAGPQVGRGLRLAVGLVHRDHAGPHAAGRGPRPRRPAARRSPSPTTRPAAARAPASPPAPCCCGWRASAQRPGSRCSVMASRPAAWPCRRRARPGRAPSRSGSASRTRMRLRASTSPSSSVTVRQAGAPAASGAEQPAAGGAVEEHASRRRGHTRPGRRRAAVRRRRPRRARPGRRRGSRQNGPVVDLLLRQPADPGALGVGLRAGPRPR